jgi:FKBP-type peptidyl-prolyl cis-trans isomerase
MPTDKRARQKAGRVSRLEEQRAADIRDHRRRRITRIVLAVAAVLAIAFVVSLLTKDDESDVATDDTSGTTSTLVVDPNETTSSTYSDQAIADEVLARTRPDPAPPAADLAKDALVATVEIEGTGAVVGETDTVTAHYVGVLADGTVFDESWARGAPSPFSLTGVIPGWTEGLTGLKIGTRVHLAIGSDKAYGPQGNPPTIPPDAPMAFTIDIVDAVPAGG